MQSRFLNAMTLLLGDKTTGSFHGTYKRSRRGNENERHGITKYWGFELQTHHMIIDTNRMYESSLPDAFTTGVSLYLNFQRTL